jgi:hypothetical protein
LSGEVGSLGVCWSGEGCGACKGSGGRWGQWLGRVCIAKVGWAGSVSAVRIVRGSAVLGADAACG